MTPEELLKEVGEPTCRVSTTGIITNQTNAPLEPGLELYTADQLIAARKGLEEKLAKAEQRVAEYNELIYAVQTKNPDETRHQTALRYIRNAENRQSYTAANTASS